MRDACAEDFCYLTTVGRKSGKPHEIEIWFACDGEGNRIFLMAGGRDQSDWVKNLRQNRSVRVRLRNQVYQGVARVLGPEEDADARARKLLLEKYSSYEEDLEEWAATSLPVEIELTI